MPNRWSVLRCIHICQWLKMMLWSTSNITLSGNIENGEIIILCLKNILETEGGPHSDISMTGGRGGERGGGHRFIFYTQKIPTSEFGYPKKTLLFLANQKRSHTSSKLCLHFCWFELMKTKIPKKSLVFSQPNKSQHLSQTPKNPFWTKIQTQKIQ